MSISRIGEFTGRQGQLVELKDFLLSIMPLIKSSQGCGSVQLYQSREDPMRFIMIEVWENIELHQASVKNIPSHKLAGIRPLLGTAPSGSYYELISAT